MLAILLILVFALIGIISYMVFDKVFFTGRAINRIYAYIGDVREPGNQDARKKIKIHKTKIAENIKATLIRIKKSIIKHNITKTKHYRKFNEQLGDAVIVISNSLKAGHSFAQALDTLVMEMPAPIKTEFGQVIREVKLGKSLEDSLQNLLERMPSKDLELMLTAILMQRETGGNLAEVLDIISETIRERVKIGREIKTLTAQGRLSAIIVLTLPIAIAGIMFVMSPDYIMQLFTNKLGLAMVVVGVFTELLGMYFIKKIVKIDV